MGNYNDSEDNSLENQIRAIKRKAMYKDDVMNLVEKDLLYGLTREQTLEYCENSKYDIKQMQIYSNLLHRDAPKEIKVFICNPEFNSAQMQVLYEYYIKGVPLERLQEGIEKDDIPKHMSELFQRYLKKIAETKTGKEQKTSANLNVNDSSLNNDVPSENEKMESDCAEKLSDKEVPASDSVTSDDTPNSKGENDAGEKPDIRPPVIPPEVLVLLQQMNQRLEGQGKYYEQMSGTLDKLNQQKEDDDVTKSLLEKYNSQEVLIVSQQEHLNDANRALARARADKEAMEQEIKKLKDLMAQEEKGDRLPKVAEEKKVSEKETEGKQIQLEKGENADMGYAQNVYATQPIPPVPNGMIPVYYQVPLLQNGRVLQQVEVERSTRKSVGGVGIFSRLFVKKKSRIDLVSRLAAGDMLPEQLAQIRVAIEKGLYEEQLVELINHSVPVAKMKEIIEIAVLENSMA